MQIRIFSQQLAFLMFLQVLGSALIYVPEAIAGRNAWISTLGAILIGFLVLSVIIRLQLMFPGVSIFKISELSLGPILGKLLNTVYLWVVFFIAILYLYDAITLLRILFPLLPAYSLRTIIILTAAYCIYKGITNVAHLAEVVIWFVLFFLIIGFIAPVNFVNFALLRPIFSEWHPLVGGILYGANWPYAEITVFALLLPYVTDLKEGRKTIYKWFGLAALAMTLRTILVISVLGPEWTMASRFPLYDVFRLVAVQNFQRVELFFFALWFITGFMAILVYYQGFLLGLKDLFDLRDYRSVIFPAGLLLLVLSIYMIPSDLYYEKIISATNPVQNLPGNILYPAIVWLAASLSYNKVKTRLEGISNTAEQSVQVQE